MANQIVIDILADTRSLVSGVNKTNQQLGTLNTAAGKTAGVLGLFSKAFLAIQGTKFVWGWVKDLAQEEKDFATLTKLYGKDADALTSRISGLATKFRIDDGAIASSAVLLGSQLSDTYKGITADILELSLQSSNINNVPLESLTTSWVKVLNAGKKLSGKEIFKMLDLGAIIGPDSDNKIAKQIESLGTINEQVAFLSKLQKNNKQVISPIQELTYDMNQLRDAAAKPLLDALTAVTPLIKKLVDLVVIDGEFTTLGQILFDVALALGAIKVASKTFGINLLEGLAAFFGLKEIWAVFNVAWHDAGEAVMEMFEEGVISKSRAFWLRFTNYLPKALGEAIAALGPAKKVALVSAILAGIFVLLPEDMKNTLKSWKDFAVDIVKTVAQSFKDANDLFWNEVLKLLSPGVEAQFKRIMAEWSAAGKDIGNALIQGLKDSMNLTTTDISNTIKMVFQNLYNAIFEWAKSFFKIASPSKVMYDLGKDIIQGLINGIQARTIWDLVSNIFVNFKNSLISWFSATSFYSYGRSIIDGLVRGMQDLAANPLNFITTLAKNMKDRFKSLFNIGSPSKVFAGYGKNLVQGLALGIDGSRNLAVNSLSGLSGAMSFNSPAFAGAGGRNPVSITINAGLGTDSYELGRVVSAALNKYAGVSGR